MTESADSGFIPLLWRPQGPQGCLEKQNCPLSWNLAVWCAKIGPRIQKLKKTSKMTGGLTKPFWHSVGLKAKVERRKGVNLFESIVYLLSKLEQYPDPRPIINYQLLNCQVFEWFQDRDIRCKIHYFLHSNLHRRMNNFLCYCHHHTIHHLDNYCNTGYRVVCSGIQREWDFMMVLVC